MIKAIIRILLGLALVASGIALEGLWLAFCFGTVVIGVVLLIWFTPILLLPFALLSMPGWRILQNGLHELRPVDVRKISVAISPIVRDQIRKVEESGNLAPLDQRVLSYVAALSFVASRRNLSLLNVIDITSEIYSDPRYKLRVMNLNYCVDYSDELRGFWNEARRMTPIAQQELAAGAGFILIQLSQTTA